jgi:hypothetical protein
MKRKVFSFLMLLGSISVFAQPWQTIIGNAVPPGAFMGTTNNQPLNFRTNNIQRITVNHLQFGMPLVPFSLPLLII